MADNYLQIGNLFQARATLQSVIDNSENTELAITAKEKLDKIKETETDAKFKQEKSGSDLDVQFEDYDIEYDNLFNDSDEGGAEEKPESDTTDTNK